MEFVCLVVGAGLDEFLAAGPGAVFLPISRRIVIKGLARDFGADGGGGEVEVAPLALGDLGKSVVLVGFVLAQAGGCGLPPPGAARSGVVAVLDAVQVIEAVVAPPLVDDAPEAVEADVGVMRAAIGGDIAGGCCLVEQIHTGLWVGGGDDPADAEIGVAGQSTRRV